MHESIWAATKKLPHFPALGQEISTDVLIIGGGMAGILTAYKLTRQGVNCVLIEGDRICRGVSGNTTAKVTVQHGLIYHRLLKQFGEERAKLYYHANRKALEEYGKLADEIDCEFLRRNNYIYSSRSPAGLEREAAALQQLGIHSDYVNHIDLPISTFGAIRFRDQAQFHPLKLVSGIVGDLKIFEQTRALEFLGDTVQTDRGKIRAGKIVVATHFPILNKHGSYFLKLYQDRSYVLGLKIPVPLKGMYLDESPEGLSFRQYGDYWLLGGGNHRTGKKTTGWSTMEEFARKYVPQGRIQYRWAAQDCITLDGVPYIGRYSKRTPNHYVATGFNKWGMSSSMVAAQVLTDLICKGASIYEPVFSPSRRMLRPQLVVNGLESTVNLLTPTVPRCPHLGCALKWNRHEHSWDCPCHGSRFDPEGNLLDGPATGPRKMSKENPGK